MLYCVDLTVPANTSKDNPVKQDVTVKSGVIRKISILIPQGHCALAHLIILYGGTQIAPWEGTIHGNAETVEWDEFIEILEPEAKLTLVAWNDDYMFDHTFYIRINVLPLWLAAPVLWLMQKITEILHKIRIPAIFSR